MEHAFTPSIHIETKGKAKSRQYGNALLSRYPTIQKKDYRFHFLIGIVEARSMLEATIQIEQKRILLFVTHLSLNPFLHHKQMKKILNEISKSPIPKLVMGDWNMKPHSKGWNEITNNLHDAWEIAGKGDGNTYPSIRPKRRLDYIFTSSSISVFAAEIIHIEPGASDHLPLRIVFSV